MFSRMVVFTMSHGVCCTYAIVAYLKWTEHDSVSLSLVFWFDSFFWLWVALGVNRSKWYNIDKRHLDAPLDGHIFWSFDVHCENYGLWSFNQWSSISIELTYLFQISSPDTKRISLRMAASNEVLPLPLLPTITVSLPIFHNINLQHEEINAKV